MHLTWALTQPDRRALAERVVPWLCRRETMNNVVLGVLNGARDTEFACAVLDDAGEPAAVAVRNPRKPVAVSPAETPEARAALAGALATHDGWDDVSGDCAVATAVADARARRVGGRTEIHRALGVYACERVSPPARAVPGRLRVVGPDEAPLLLRWVAAFSAEVNEPHDHAAAPEWAGSAIADGRPHLWELSDGTPASLAAWAGPTPSGIRVNAVYTPPDLRGRGYAGACVSELTRRLLASGRRFVFLYTDLANPISNRLYQKLGYQRAGDSAHLRVVSAR